MGKKISNSSKKSTPKKRSGFSKLVRSPAFIVAVSIIVIISGYFAYKTVHYYSAPAEIKLIRTLPIYNYESDNLKIVSRSEDYGGTDWKNVYNKPVVNLYFTDSSIGSGKTCTDIVEEGLNRLGWVQSGSYSMLGSKSVLGKRFESKQVGSNVDLSLEPYNETSKCLARITVR